MGLHDCGIPEDRLPPCWNDDVRMNALFAPFRLKIANPESWEMKMKFWSDMLRQWCRAKGDAVLTAADAKVTFQRKGRTPACIEIVVEEMFRSGELSPISKYQQILHSGPEGWVRWGARLAFKPAAIALTAVTSLMPGRQAVDDAGLPKASIDSTQRFVLEGVLKEQATAILTSYPPGVERVGSVDELMKRCGWGAGRDAFEIALGWLVANGAAVVKDDVVKLAEPSKKATEVTQAEEALVRLEQSRARLQADAERYAREVTAAHADARAAYVCGSEHTAKNHLRRRHRATQRLRQCEDTMENVTLMLHRLRDADTNRTIVDTYKSTSMAMKDTNLNEDTVLDTMDDLKEIMESYNVVEKALSGAVEDVDTSELEAELSELLGHTGPAGGPPPGKHTPVKAISVPGVAPPATRARSPSEREFIFDGEERILDELNKLGVEDATPPAAHKTSQRSRAAQLEAVEARPWQSSAAGPDVWNNNYEVRLDERLHPGQSLNIDFSSPPLYGAEFLVRDHKRESNVWLYNPGDDHRAGDDQNSSQNKTSGNFQMAPGGERGEKKSTPKAHAWATRGLGHDDDISDIERRLNNLRGFNL